MVFLSERERERVEKNVRRDFVIVSKGGREGVSIYDEKGCLKKKVLGMMNFLFMEISVSFDLD